MEKLFTCCWICLFALALAILGAWVTRWAWNTVMPDLFHLAFINWWQALAINIILGTIGGAFRVKGKVK